MLSYVTSGSQTSHLECYGLSKFACKKVCVVPILFVGWFLFVFFS